MDLWKDDHADQIVGRAIQVDLAGRSIRVVEAHDLIAMKLRAGRLKDDYDISQILVNTAIDETRLEKLATREQLAHFEQIKIRS